MIEANVGGMMRGANTEAFHPGPAARGEKSNHRVGSVPATLSKESAEEPPSLPPGTEYAHPDRYAEAQRPEQLWPTGSSSGRAGYPHHQGHESRLPFRWFFDFTASLVHPQPRTG